MSFDRAHGYDVTLDWEENHPGLLSAGDRVPIVAGPPSDFGGKDTWWSPEHMLLAAVSSCLMTTFLALAAREKLQLGAYRAVAHATVEKASTGLVLSSLRLDVHLKTEAHEATHAVSVMEKAKRDCIVGNALKPAIEVHLDVTAS